MFAYITTDFVNFEFGQLTGCGAVYIFTGYDEDEAGQRVAMELCRLNEGLWYEVRTQERVTVISCEDLFVNTGYFAKEDGNSRQVVITPWGLALGSGTADSNLQVLDPAAAKIIAKDMVANYRPSAGDDFTQDWPVDSSCRSVIEACLNCKDDADYCPASDD